MKRLEASLMSTNIFHSKTAIIGIMAVTLALASTIAIPAMTGVAMAQKGPDHGDHGYGHDNDHNKHPSYCYYWDWDGHHNHRHWYWTYNMPHDCHPQMPRDHTHHH